MMCATAAYCTLHRANAWSDTDMPVDTQTDRQTQRRSSHGPLGRYL